MSLELKFYLNRQGVSCHDFAKQLNITPKYLSMIVNGKILPSVRLSKDIEAATAGAIKLPFSQRTKKARKIAEEEKKKDMEKEKEQQQKKNEPIFPYFEKLQQQERQYAIDPSMEKDLVMEAW